MPRLVVVNSFGPMGSTLLAALLEKLGFGNVPLRKTELHQYLMGLYALDSGVMQQRVINTIKDHAQPGQRGGVSIIDRGNQTPHALTGTSHIQDKIASYKQTVFTSLQDLYSASHRFYYDAVVYKPMTNNRDWHIELTVDIHRYDHKKLYQAYQDHFDDVRMIHLHRPFRGWINSLASQAFVHPDLKNRMKFFPHKRYEDYKLYEDAVAQMPGLNIGFDDLFDKPIETLAADCARFLDVPFPTTDWRAQEYDMYGKIIPYEKAFTRFDDKRSYLQPKTLDYLAELAANDGHGMKNPVHQALSWGRYLVDMQQYRKENLKS